MTLALQATGITKRFPGVLAKDHVNFSLERSDIFLLLLAKFEYSTLPARLGEKHFS
jgi:hypothetical protein